MMRHGASQLGSSRTEPEGESVRRWSPHRSKRLGLPMCRPKPKLPTDLLGGQVPRGCDSAEIRADRGCIFEEATRRVAMGSMGSHTRPRLNMRRSKKLL